jgi:hypothetical protein
MSSTSSSSSSSSSSTSSSSSSSSYSSSSSPSKINFKILLAKYQFKRGSPLQEYLQTKMREKYGILTFTFTLGNLLSDLKYIIKKENLFDPLNPTIILCDSNLEVALNIKALHVREIKDYVLTQLVCIVPFQTSLKNPCYAIETRNERKLHYYNELENQINQREQQMNQQVFKEAENYRLKPLFKRALKRMPSFPHHQRTFKYNEICIYLSKYIIFHKYDLFDPRNIKLCMVHNDPLGKAFNVKAFHRSQLTSLLRRNIIAV